MVCSQTAYACKHVKSPLSKINTKTSLTTSSFAQKHLINKVAKTGQNSSLHTIDRHCVHLSLH